MRERESGQERERKRERERERERMAFTDIKLMSKMLSTQHNTFSFRSIGIMD